MGRIWVNAVAAPNCLRADFSPLGTTIDLGQKLGNNLIVDLSTSHSRGSSRLLGSDADVVIAIQPGWS
jgi:hypothetical protein